MKEQLTPLYQLERVSKIFDSQRRGKSKPTTALAEVNMSVQAGEFLAIVGRSGEGKSTLLHLLGALDDPTDGSLYYQDKRLCEYGLDAFRRKEVGFVFQMFHLLPYRTALDNVATGLTVGGATLARARQEAQTWLVKLGLGERLQHLPHELSGGEKQRVAIARAVVKNPRVLLADEPTGNLDRESRVDVLEALAGLNQEHGITIVMVTHNVADAKKYAHRVIQVDDRRIDDTVPHDIEQTEECSA